MKAYNAPEFSMIACSAEDILTLSLSADGVVNDNVLFDDMMNQD